MKSINKNLTIIVSTGQGRLHLLESAQSLNNKDIQVKVITGWLPSKYIPNVLIDFFGFFLGRSKLSVGLRKRNLYNIKSTHIFSCWKSEFLIQILFLLSSIGVLKRDLAATIGWKMFGYESRKYIKQADIFHVRSGSGQGNAIKKAKENGMKVVVDHSIAHPLELYQQLLKANNGHSKDIDFGEDSRFWNMVLKDCHDADLIQVNSTYVKDSFVKNGFDADKLRVVHLGVRQDFLSIKTNYALQGVPNILFTGGFGLRKGANIIIKTVSELNRMGVRFNLNIVGSIMDDVSIPSEFSDLPNVKMHGHVEQDKLKAFFLSSDLYIFPSYCEGSAQSLKEAMAAGLPVIATKQGGAPIIDRENGIIILDDSVDELTQSIVELLDNESLRAEIGKNASNTIGSNHTWDKYAYNTLKIYKELLTT